MCVMYIACLFALLYSRRTRDKMRRCRLLPNYFGHLLKLILLVSLNESEIVCKRTINIAFCCLDVDSSSSKVRKTFKSLFTSTVKLQKTLRRYDIMWDILVVLFRLKNWVVGCWCGYLSGATCRLASGPADATATHCLLLHTIRDAILTCARKPT